jgi:hypothetical protein
VHGPWPKGRSAQASYVAMLKRRFMENVPVMRHNDEGRAPYTRVCDVARKICPDRRAAGLFVTGGGVRCEADGTPAPHAIPFCRHSRESGNPFGAAEDGRATFFQLRCRPWIPAFAGMTCS